MKRIFYISIIILLSSIVSCSDKIEPENINPVIPEEPSEEDNEPEKPSWPLDQQGKTYVWDRNAMPHICIEISVANWNHLLTSHDVNQNISSFVSCTVVFDKAETKDTVKLTGLRIRDNDDGKRPEGKKGQNHSRSEAEWNFCNYELDFDRYEEGSSLRNVKGMLLKSCCNDPSYARERYCYDLFRRYGIWTIGMNNYCRLSIHVEGDEKPAYIGVYQMIETLDDSYFQERAADFSSREGFLWRCSNGATLKNSGFATCADKGNAEYRPYMLMNNQERLTQATTQLSDFITNLNLLKGEKFHAWISSVCDMELLLRTYAVMTTAGIYDDYWNNGNNYHLYFNSTDKDDYQVFFIPYDFEKSLGTSEISVIYDTGEADPYKWGDLTTPLLNKILTFDDFKAIYTNALYELILPESYLFDPDYSMHAVKDLMYEVSFYTKNDTGTGMTAVDIPATWSSTKSYNLTKNNEKNFFKVRSESIRHYLPSV